MRKPQIQPSLASLTLADREQLADWLRREDYDVVLERVVKPRPEGLDLDISKKPLQTFYAKVALMDIINARLPENKRFTLAQFECLASAEQEKIAETHAQILRTTADLAASAQSANELATLQRLADFPARAAVRAQLFECRAQRMEIDHNKEQRAQAKEQRATEAHASKREMQPHRIAMDQAHLRLAESTLQLREQTLELRREESARRAANSKLNTKNSKLSEQADHLGPYAADLEGIRERARKHFGITPEESARRAALRKAWMARKNSNSGDETHASTAPVFVRENPSPEGTLDNSPAASAPGDSAAFQFSPKGTAELHQF